MQQFVPRKRDKPTGGEGRQVSHREVLPPLWGVLCEVTASRTEPLPIFVHFTEMALAAFYLLSTFYNFLRNTEAATGFWSCSYT